MMTEGICRYCHDQIWSEHPNAGGAPWRDAEDQSWCPENPGRWANSFGPHEVEVKPREIEAAIASIMEACK